LYSENVDEAIAKNNFVISRESLKKISALERPTSQNALVFD
jgi:hypothetical protein